MAGNKNLKAMKTKTYKFEVTIKVEEPKGSFLQKLKDELNREAEELKICKEINKQSEEIHAKMLMDFVSEVENEIGEIISSVSFRKATLQTNEYHQSLAEIRLCSGLIINLKAIPKNSKIDGIRYTTFADGISLEYGVGNIASWAYSSMLMDVDRFLERFKDEIKHAIKRLNS
jgi:hypothetical protein